jgi:hypothetical protein
MIDMSELFGGIIPNYDPDDEPGPHGISYNELLLQLDINCEEGWAVRKMDVYSGVKNNVISATAGDLFPRQSTLYNHQIKLSYIIWVHAHYGNWCWPPLKIDHKDGNDINNRIDNLRIGTQGQNCMNTKSYSNNKSGHRGVFWYDYGNYFAKWQANIRVNKKLIILGWFDNFEDAVAARLEAEDKYFGEFAARHSRSKLPMIDLFA